MDTWVDFKVIKQSVSMQQVLTYYGIDSLRRQGDELRGQCPIHKGEGARTFHVNVAKNVFKCFSCGAKGNVLDFVAAMEQCSARDAALKLKEWFSVRESPPGKPATQEKPKPESINRESPAGAVNPPLGFQLRVDCGHEYGLSRGLRRETLEYFGAGLCLSKGMFGGRFVIPLHNASGELIGYAGRSLDDKAEPKYLLPSNDKGFYKSHMLFNLNRVLEDGYKTREACDLPLDDPVLIVEGFFSTMRMTELGVPWCVSILGSSLSLQQEDLLCMYFRRAVVLFDGDDAGRNATNDCLLRLGKRLWVTAICLPDGLQPDELPKEALTDLLGPL
jgi:DNA primase